MSATKPSNNVYEYQIFLSVNNKVRPIFLAFEIVDNKISSFHFFVAGMGHG